MNRPGDKEGGSGLSGTGTADRAGGTLPDGVLLLSIGGIVGRLHWGEAPTPFLEQLRERYQPYAIPPAEWVRHDFTLDITFVPASAVVEGDVRAGQIAARPLRVEELDDEIRIGRWDFRARLTAHRRDSAARTRNAERRAPGPQPGRSLWRGQVTCQMNPFSFDSLLRVLWSIFLPRAGGALFHACAIRLGEAGLIFPGQSGAGKSTLARKTPEPERILTDELVAVSRGDLGRWRISGTPFWGEFKRGGGSIRTWPLDAISFLEQSDELGVRSLPPGEATLRLLGCFLCFQTDANTAARNLAIAVELCSEIAALALRSTRETPMSAIESALSGYLPPRERGDSPPTPREMISEFRWLLMQHRQYAYKPRGNSMRPWLRPGDALFIQATGEAEVSLGDILLYWTPGATPDEDRLTCHRMVARLSAGATQGGRRKFKFYMKGDAVSGIEGFENGAQSEILGRVSALSRDGKMVPMPGRIGNLARLVGSLVAAPLLKMAGR